ncbi:MAG: family hydrolase [Solirubrobacterales bacterium]|nr:family hydrolase [Solirubrobacterales bacterium]
MATVDDLVARIHAAERGPQVAAAFDYDGTLISGYSAGAFYEHRIRSGDMGPVELTRTALTARRGIADAADFETFFSFSLAAWRGVEEAEMEALGDRLFRRQIAARLHHEALALLEAHRAMGHTLVLASSAMRFQTEPMARELGIDHVLNTEVRVVDGRLTGELEGSPLWGPEKARGLQSLAAAEGLDLRQSFVYSNGREDLPFLEAAGNATAIEPDDELFAEARLRGWPVLRCAPGRGILPGATDLARTAAFYGGMFTALGAGVGVGLLRRSRGRLVDVAMGMGSDVSLTLAGVDVHVVRGAEHLWSSRPCVFVFNHTSKLDPVVVMKLVRENFTGVAKAQAKHIPVFGQLFQLAGVAFVERGDHLQARQALEPVVQRLREGTSLLISPEGTRTPTPRLAPFKKGPFHIAMQAQVPIVPIVLRGVDRVQSRGGQVIRPGTVEVVVLAPVDTSGWKAEKAGDHRDEVRAQMLDVLHHWPREEAVVARGDGA